MELIDGLALGHPNRTFGTKENVKASRWVADQMKALRLLPGNDDSYFQGFTFKIGDEDYQGRNVVGLIRGTDPVLKDEVVIVAAHHDSQEDTNQGANDNATGCAAVLAIAEALVKNPPKRSVLFVTFDGEEGLRRNGVYHAGRRGSRKYAENPVHPLNKTAMLVNLDMIGQVHLESGPRDTIYQWASGDRFAGAVMKRATQATQHLGKSLDGYPEQPQEAQFFTTDAEPLYRLGVPTINFLSGRDLENHNPKDITARVIPERQEQYTRRAYQCVLEAANSPEPLSQMGISPGGLMPTYPLVRERKNQGTNVPAEEAMRLSSLFSRLPELKSVAGKLVQEMAQPRFIDRLYERTGFDLGDPKELLTETKLAAVRAFRAGMVEEYRAIPKANIDARKAKAEQLTILSGVEDVLSGALYLSVIHSDGSYYVQRIPERLNELTRGAKKLALTEHTRGIDAKDTKRFSAEVNADRAVHLAKETAPGLYFALSQAVFALLSPENAANSERPIQNADLGKLEASMTRVAESVLGRAQDDAPELLRASITGAMFDSTLSKLKGSGAKWVKSFAESNMLVDFVPLAKTIGVEPRFAQALEEALLGGTDAELNKAIVEFYSAAMKAGFGGIADIESIQDVIALGKEKVVETLLDERKTAIEGRVSPEAIEAAGADPKVRSLEQLRTLVSATLDLQKVFVSFDDGKSHQLSADVSLADFANKLDAIGKASRGIEGGESVATELSFWTRWMTPYFLLEKKAGLQASERREAASSGIKTLKSLWPKTAERLDTKLDMVGAYRAARALIENAGKKEPPERDILAESEMKRIGPFIEARIALEDLVLGPGPGRTATLEKSIRAIAGQHGEGATAELQRAHDKLVALEKLNEIQIGRNERSGPMAVLNVRTLQKRNDG
jgi:hypothetical protein